MPRTAIAVQEISATVGLEDAVFSAGDSANGHEFENTGKELLLMKSTNGALPAIVQSVTDENGRELDITLTPGAADISIAGPLRPAIWNQRATADIGNVHVDIADATAVTFAVVRFV